jgi:hypothetical protein
MFLMAGEKRLWKEIVKDESRFTSCRGCRVASDGIIDAHRFTALRGLQSQITFSLARIYNGGLLNLRGA